MSGSGDPFSQKVGDSGWGEPAPGRLLLEQVAELQEVGQLPFAARQGRITLAHLPRREERIEEFDEAAVLPDRLQFAQLRLFLRELPLAAFGLELRDRRDRHAADRGGQQVRSRRTSFDATARRTVRSSRASSESKMFPVRVNTAGICSACSSAASSSAS